MKIGFSELLTAIFLVLKLTGVIHWSWLLVFSPLIFDAILTIALIVIKIKIEESDNELQ